MNAKVVQTLPLGEDATPASEVKDSQDDRSVDEQLI